MLTRTVDFRPRSSLGSRTAYEALEDWKAVLTCVSPLACALPVRALIALEYSPPNCSSLVVLFLLAALGLTVGYAGNEGSGDRLLLLPEVALSPYSTAAFLSFPLCFDYHLFFCRVLVSFFFLAYRSLLVDAAYSLTVDSRLSKWISYKVQ